MRTGPNIDVAQDAETLRFERFGDRADRLVERHFEFGVKSDHGGLLYQTLDCRKRRFQRRAVQTFRRLPSDNPEGYSIALDRIGTA